jgi:hypothetical protein
MHTLTHNSLSMFRRLRACPEAMMQRPLSAPGTSPLAGMLSGVRPLSRATRMDDWAAKEFGGAKLGDGHLTKRLIKVASAFAERPTASIPGACSGWVETQAAYRFFDQASEEKHGLGWEDIPTPHLECTLARMRQLTVMTFPGTLDHESHGRFPLPRPLPRAGKGRFVSRIRDVHDGIPRSVGTAMSEDFFTSA